MEASAVLICPRNSLVSILPKQRAENGNFSLHHRDSKFALATISQKRDSIGRSKRPDK